MDIKIFAGSNTKDGFVGFYDKLKEYFNLKKLFILKGTPGCGKSTFIKNFRNSFPNEQAILLPCSFDPNSLDGVIFPTLGFGMIDGTAPHVVDDGEIVNLHHTEKDGSAQLTELVQRKQKHLQMVRKHLNQAFNAHIQIEAYYKPHIDFNKHKVLLDKCVSSVWREGTFNN